MEPKSNSSALKRFIINVLALDIVLLIVASFSSIVLKLNFGYILLFSGILIGGIGAFLGDQASLDPMIDKGIPSKHFLEYIPPPNKFLSDQISQSTENSVSRYGLANVMTLAGIVTIVSSIPFLTLLRLSR